MAHLIEAQTPIALIPWCALAVISVVIPVRGDEHACARLLAELAPYRGRQVEVLVVVAEDSKLPVPSHDPEAADEWLFCSPGRAKQLALGAARARHGCLWFLHADTQNIAAAAQWLLRRCTQPQGSSGWGRFEVRFDDDRWLYKVVPWFMNWRSRLTSIATGDQGIFVDRSLLETVGGWPQQQLMEDVELCARLRRHVRPSLPRRGDAPLVTSARRWRANGVLRTILLMWSLRLRYALGADPATLHKTYYEDNQVAVEGCKQ